MNSRERFYATVERKPVDRPACWLGDPTPEAVPALCEYYHVDNIKELKKVCGDDFYAVEIPYKSPTCSAIFAAFDWYMNGSDIDTEHRTLTAEGCFAQCEDIEDIEAVNFEWPDPALYIDPEALSLEEPFHKSVHPSYHGDTDHECPGFRQQILLSENDAHERTGTTPHSVRIHWSAMHYGL